MRKAGDLIREYLREGRLAANRSQPIGAGSYGTVYQSDIPGNVIKQKHGYDTYDFVEEADLQSAAADMGIAPRVVEVETFPGGVGDRIEMTDARINYKPVAAEGDAWGAPGVGEAIDPAIRIKTAQQQGMLALKGIRLEDRRGANIMQHKMTGRPLQLDFGIAGKMSPDQQAAHLAHVTAEGFEAAGIEELGGILRATVMDYLEGGQVKEAMDVAKQGFSRLQKIKAPVVAPTTKDPGEDMFEQMMANLEKWKPSSD